MEDEPTKPAAKKSTSKKLGKAAVEGGKKAAEMADRAATVAEGASNAFGAVKWTAIAVVTLTFAGGGYAIYKAVSVPAKAVGNAVEGVSDAVISGSEKVKEGSSEVLNRLVISVSDPARLNRLSEAAFESLSAMAVTEPEGIKDRLFRAKNFSGHEGRICDLSVDFGNGAIPVVIAADNEAYATSKALGSKNDRLIRMLLTAGDETIGLKTQWDTEAGGWALKWKATTLKKPVEDYVAHERVMDVLEAAAARCE